jgi:four helix bundle protein
MHFDHERLDVYQAALRFCQESWAVIKSIPSGSGDLPDQLARASTSICLNIGEGAGEYSRKDKARFYRIAKRSATECAAIVDICRVLKLSPPERLARCRTELLNIVCMLIKLVKALERP